MKSVIPIDETWTPALLRRQLTYANEILSNNHLPFLQNPFAPIYIQQEQYLQQTASWTDLIYREIDQVNAVCQNLNDVDKAYAIAMLGITAWKRYQLTQQITGYLQVPDLLVTERTAVNLALQTFIRGCGDLLLIREKLAIQAEVDVMPSSEGLSAADTDWFWKPTGDVMFGVEGQTPIEIPAWPESVKDSTSATWSQEMTTYQFYEPKQTYKGSGPRTVSCTFKLHRAMWDGNQDSGNAEALVAYMESACYPDYDTQAAEPPRSLLTIGKSIRIRGIMTSFDKTYQGPIGPDNKYDEIIISISIVEESDNVLSTSAVRGGLAGWR